ncbi:MAG: Uma2 family endonuclease [Gemmataceae bacterium]
MIETKLLRPSESLYPSGDGEPMAETPIHVEAIILLGQALEDVLGSDWFVGMDLFWYHEEGNPKARVAPDLIVVPHVGKTDRRSFFSWIESHSPVVVFDMASKGTWKNDFEDKFRTYESLGVPEYFIFDPKGEYVVPRLQGFRLENGVYRRIPTIDDEGTLASQSLGLLLRADGEMIRLIRTENREPVLTRREQIEMQRKRFEEQSELANALKSQAEVERQRADDERVNRLIETKRADDERVNRLIEKKRADDLAAEVERLKKELQAKPSS